MRKREFRPPRPSSSVDDRTSGYARCMHLDKDIILQFLQKQGAHDKVDRARNDLPDQVDTEQHKGVLDRLGIDIGDLMSLVQGGAVGDIGKKLGGFLK